MALAGCSSTLQPITDVQAREAAFVTRSKIASNQEPILQPITLYEAMARALKYNLEHRVSMMEIDVARADYELSRYELLPNVIASGRSQNRNNQAGSSSLSLISGRQSLEPSTATEKTFQTGDLTATWNILDFGLSKIRIEQLADKALIYEERRRKAVIHIIGDVQRAYWRAVSSERISQRLLSLEEDVRGALGDSKTLYERGKASPMLALSYQRELSDIQGQAQRLMRDMTMAKVELSGLMGLSPDQPFTLKSGSDDRAPAMLEMDYEAMIDLSLRQRPEVRETLYAKRIGEKEMKKAVLETLPSLEAFAGLNVNTNDFLFHSNWADYGARASWNLARVFSVKPRKRKAKAQALLDEQRGLAAAIAVMTQLAIAREHYEGVRTEYQTAEHSAQIQDDILKHIEALSKAGSASRQSLVKERMNSLISETQRDILRGEMKEAAANIYASLGYDPYGVDVRGDEDVATIATSLQAHWERRKILLRI